MAMRYFLFILLLLPLFAQKTTELERIRREISQLEKKISHSKKTLQNEVERVHQVERKITLLNKAVTILDNQIKKETATLAQLENGVKQGESEVETLRKRIEEQTLLLFLRKYDFPSANGWDIRQWSKWMRMRKMTQFLLEYEANLANEIHSKTRHMDSLRQQKAVSVKKLKQNRAEKQKEKKKLNATRRERQKLVKQIKNNQKLWQKALAEKKKSYQKLKNYLKEIEKRRKSGKSTSGKTAPAAWTRLKGKFSVLRGKLNWPVSGKVLEHFGKHRQKNSKITTVNTGIDIKAGKGTPVRVVHDGLVVKITYLGGWGNTIIVDHKDGYYTVYSHLDEVTVHENQFVKSGDIIGKVGDSGSLDGTKLHFEIYSNDKPRNPEKWLKK